MPTNSWRKILSKSHKRYYYYNCETGESRWDLPSKSSIVQHYNRLSRETKFQRQTDILLPVRCIHNWVKAHLIGQSCPDKAHVIDICCGKGGDLFKYSHHAIATYTGFDVAASALEVAKSRAASVPFPCTFTTQDLRAHPIPKPPKLYTFASLQFALHYFWECEAHARCVLTSLAASLAPRSRVVITVPDAHVLIRLLLSGKVSSQQKVTIWNPMYSIEMERAVLLDAQNGRRAYGCPYTFSTGHSVQNCQEYLVFPHHLESLALECGLVLVEQGNFHEVVYRALQAAPHRTLSQFKTFKIPRQVPPHAWEVSQLYRAFVFQKKGSAGGASKRKR